MATKKNAGKVFEECWKNSYEKLPIYYLRLLDTAKWNRGAQSSFTPENPYDSLQFKMPFMWLLELKSTSGSSVSFYPNRPYEKSKKHKGNVMIKPNQVKSLMKAVETEGIIAGFIINFRERKLKTISYSNETFFVHIMDFIKFVEKTSKSGINREDCKKIGLKIDSKLKKVNYTYDVKGFTEISPKVYLERGHINREALQLAKSWIIELLQST
ncbi:hypothetical protein D3C74_317920 [compost metagenome]